MVFDKMSLLQITKQRNFLGLYNSLELFITAYIPTRSGTSSLPCQETLSEPLKVLFLKIKLIPKYTDFDHTLITKKTPYY